MSTAPLSSSIQSRSPLLHAWHDPLAGIKTHSACVKLADLNCDGDAKLCICDYDRKMRVYKGTNLVMENPILDSPTALCITYMEATMVSRNHVLRLLSPRDLLRHDRERERGEDLAFRLTAIDQT